MYGIAACLQMAQVDLRILSQGFLVSFPDPHTQQRMDIVNAYQAGDETKGGGGGGGGGGFQTCILGYSII